MDIVIKQALERYILSRNGRRSAERAAEGFVSGKRIDALKASQRQENNDLLVLADWVEEQARAALGQTPTPRRR